MIGRAPCGCPITHRGVTVHRIACGVRIGTPRVFPPTPVEVAQARFDIMKAFADIAERAGDMAATMLLPPSESSAEIDQFIEWAKQRLHVIALARTVLPSDDGKANPSND